MRPIAHADGSYRVCRLWELFPCLACCFDNALNNRPVVIPREPGREACGIISYPMLGRFVFKDLPSAFDILALRLQLMTFSNRPNRNGRCACSAARPSSAWIRVNGRCRISWATIRPPVACRCPSRQFALWRTAPSSRKSRPVARRSNNFPLVLSRTEKTPRSGMLNLGADLQHMSATG